MGTPIGRALHDFGCPTELVSFLPDSGHRTAFRRGTARQAPRPYRICKPVPIGQTRRHHITRRNRQLPTLSAEEADKKVGSAGGVALNCCALATNLQQHSRGNMLPAVVLRAVIADCSPASPPASSRRAAVRQPLGANRLPFRRWAHDDAAAAALDSFDDLASLERRLALWTMVWCRNCAASSTRSQVVRIEPGGRVITRRGKAICIGALLTPMRWTSFRR